MRVILLILIYLASNVNGICQYTTTTNDFSRDRALFDSDMARGNNAAEVGLSGTSNAPNGSSIQARAVSTDDSGATTTNWTTIATVSGGVWSGVLNTPRSSSWYKAETRVQGSTVTSQTSNRFGVGVIVLHSGQSNYARVANIDGNATPMLIGNNGDNFQMWRIENRNVNGTDDFSTIGGPYFITDSNPRTDALQAMAAMYHQNAPGLKIMVLFDVVVGQGQYKTLNDSEEERSWQSILKLFGRGAYAGTGPMSDGQKLGIFVQGHVNNIPDKHMAEWYMAACLGKKMDGSDISGISKTSGFATTNLLVGVGGSGITFWANHIWPEAIPELLTGRTQVQLKEPGDVYSTDEYPENKDDQRRAREVLASDFPQHFYWADEYPFLKRYYPDGSNANHHDVHNIYGSPLKGQSLVVSVLRQIGSTPFSIPHFDIINKTSSYIELGSTQGPVTTIARAEGDFNNFPVDPVTAPSTPGNAEVLGFQYSDFTVPTRVEIVDASGNSSSEGLIRVYLDPGYTQLYYGMGSAGMTETPRVGFETNEELFMRHLPIVNVGLNGRIFEHGVWVMPYTDREFINDAGIDPPDEYLAYDDFEDGNANGWTTSGGSWSVVQESGNYVYQQSNSTSGTPAVASIGSSTWSDYSVEAKVKIITSTGGGPGISFRYSSTSERYQLYIASNGDLSVQKKFGGSTITLNSSSTSLASGVWYKLKVDVHDNQFDVYLDDSYSFTAIDSANSHPVGKVALNTWKASARFDDISISEYSTSQPDVILEDDFEDGDAIGWTTSNGNWSVVQESGNYVYQQSTSGGNANAIATIGDPTWTDYSVEAMIKPTASTGGGPGISFRYVSSSERYQIYIGSSGNLLLQKKHSGTTTTLYTHASNIIIGNWHKIKVNIHDNTFDVYLDDSYVFTAVDNTDPIPAGKIALNSWKASAKFDNVLVSGSEDVEPLAFMSEVEILSEVFAYPNPAVNEVTVHLPEENSTVMFYDFEGNLRQANILQKTKKSITYNISTLPKGIYLLKIFDGSKHHTQRLILK